MREGYLKRIKVGAWYFLEAMNEGNYRHVKYTYSGDLRGSDLKWGLGNFVFAVKILYMTNLLGRVSEEGRNHLYEGIISFTQCDGGYIIDSWITENNLKGRILKGLGWRKEERILEQEEKKKIWRAETRQAFCGLFLLGKGPKYAFEELPEDGGGVREYLESLDWSHPWDAGSHLSHLLFFIEMNNFFFKGKSKKRMELIQLILDWASGIRSGLDGCWYKGRVTLQEKINGAMKVLTGLRVIGHNHFGYVHQLVDTCLKGVQKEHACDHFNIVYILYCCFKIDSEYRSREVKKFLEERICFYERHYHERLGGFSFYEKRANNIYYGKKVSLKRNEPDIHGTALFIGGLSMIDEMLGLGLGLKVAIN